MAIVAARMCMRSSLGTNCVASDFFAGRQMIARLWDERDGYMAEYSQLEFGLLQSFKGRAKDRPIYVEVEPTGEEKQATETGNVLQEKSVPGLRIHRETQLRHNISASTWDKVSSALGFAGVPMHISMVHAEIHGVTCSRERLGSHLLVEYPSLERRLFNSPGSS